MGDMADYALDQVMDCEDDRFQYMFGNMSDARAYELGIIDERGFYDHRPMFQTRITTKTCRYCGKRGLEWRDTGGGWRLADPCGTIHTCEQYPRNG
jgi:hypothetical protein